MRDAVCVVCLPGGSVWLCWRKSTGISYTLLGAALRQSESGGWRGRAVMERLKEMAGAVGTQFMSCAFGFS